MTLQYQGWAFSAKGDKTPNITAVFTKANGESVHHPLNIVRHMRKKEKGNTPLRRALDSALEDGPRFFLKFRGWKNVGRDGKEMMLATFISLAGRERTYSLSSLKRMIENPPPKSSPYDHALLLFAEHTAPPSTKIK